MINLVITSFVRMRPIASCPQPTVRTMSSDRRCSISMRGTRSLWTRHLPRAPFERFQIVAGFLLSCFIVLIRTPCTQYNYKENAKFMGTAFTTCSFRAIWDNRRLSPLTCHHSHLTPINSLAGPAFPTRPVQSRGSALHCSSTQFVMKTYRPWKIFDVASAPFRCEDLE